MDPRVEADEKLPKPAIAIVGAGRVGTSLGRLLAERGYPILGVVCRSLERAEEAVAYIGSGTAGTDPRSAVQGAGIVLLTVPDHAVKESAELVATARPFDERDLLIHASGALSADVMRTPSTERALLLSVHPIQTVADRATGYRSLRGAYFGIEGTPEAVAAGEALVATFGGRALAIKPGSKALYHAAACVASNYLVTLIDASLSLYERAGIPRTDAEAALIPLLRGTLANVDRLGLPDALTGPIERGDRETVRDHLSALEALGDPGLEALYRLLGLQTVKVAQAKNDVLKEKHHALRDLLRSNIFERVRE